jgi:hypothetical protein
MDFFCTTTTCRCQIADNAPSLRKSRLVEVFNNETAYSMKYTKIRLIGVAILLLGIGSCQDQLTSVPVTEIERDFVFAKKKGSLPLPPGIVIEDDGYELETIVTGITAQAIETVGSNIYLIEHDAIRLSVLKRNGELRRIADDALLLSEPPTNVATDVAFANGRFYVNAFRHGVIFQVTRSGKVSEFFQGLGGVGQEGSRPVRLVTDIDGNLFVAEIWDQRRVVRIDPSGQLQELVFGTPKDPLDFNYDDMRVPTGMDVSSKKILYVGNRNNGNIRAFDLSNMAFPVQFDDGADVSTIPNISSAAFPNHNFLLDLSYSERDHGLYAVTFHELYFVGGDDIPVLLVSGLTGWYNGVDVARNGDVIFSDFGTGHLFRLTRKDKSGKSEKSKKSKK